MASIAPFRGMRYDPDAVGDLGAVVAPPYDVIGDDARDELEAASPHNIVRLVLGRDDPSDDETSNKYTRARGLLEAWLAAGVLRRDAEPSLYLYEQRYRVGSEDRVQRGVLGAVRLDEDGGVLPHERTYDDIVDDRLRLLRATATNLDCILVVHDGGDAAAHDAIDATCDTDPASRFTTPDGIEHGVWRVSDRGAIEVLARSIEKAQLVIADGHHRHRTAREYGAERHAAEGPGPWDAQLMLVVDAGRWGPTLLPIHRTVRGLDAAAALERLRPAFRVEEASTTDPDALAAELAKRRIYDRTFVMIDGAAAWWLTISDKVAEREALPPDRSPAWRDLDVAVLHTFVFGSLLGDPATGFVHSPAEAAEAIARGDADLGFLLAPMSFEQVRAVAEAKEAMPQKSTFFQPKPATGAVLRPLDDLDAVSG